MTSKIIGILMWQAKCWLSEEEFLNIIDPIQGRIQDFGLEGGVK